MSNSIHRLIQENIKTYQDAILLDLQNNARLRNLLSKILYNSEIDVYDRIRSLVVTDFGPNQSSKEYLVALPCASQDLKRVDQSFLNSKRLAEFEVFSSIRYETYEEAATNYPSKYYLIKSNFVELIDDFLLSHLDDYKHINKGLYSKQVTEGLTLSLDTQTGRDNEHDLYQYLFPLIRIDYHGERMFQKGDPKSLLFLGDASFFSFYLWSNKFDLNTIHTRKGHFERKQGEPVIYQQEDSSYILTNSSENIDHWNGYIEVVVGVFVHCLAIYEKWLKSVFSKDG